MSLDTAEIPGIDEAMKLLDEMEAGNGAAPEADAASATDTREPQSPDAQATVEKSNAQNSDSTSPDTRATAEQANQAKPGPDAKPTTEKPAEQAKPAEQPKPDANQSRYAKSQERLNKTWEQVNADKTALAADRTKLDTERAEFARQRAEFEAVREQAQKPQFTPQDYLNAAQSKKQLADHQRAQAQRLEDSGKFAEAESLRKQAQRNEAASEDLAEHAESLRRNPPQGFAQHQQQYEQAKKAWTFEAAKAFPELAKDGSPFQQAVAGHLNALAKSDPKLLANPSVIYHVSRLVAAETAVQALKADAARVPVLMKEAESLRAKIKELEALTTPAGGGSVAKIGDADDFSTLQSEAQGIRF